RTLLADLPPVDGKARATPKPSPPARPRKDLSHLAPLPGGLVRLLRGRVDRPLPSRRAQARGQLRGGSLHSRRDLPPGNRTPRATAQLGLNGVPVPSYFWEIRGASDSHM